MFAGVLAAVLEARLENEPIKEIIIAGFKSAFMPYREKADLVAEISRELATYQDPRGEVAGRVGLVESDPAIAAPAAPPAKPKLVSQT